MARLLQVADGPDDTSAADALRSAGHRLDRHPGTAGALDRICRELPDLILLEGLPDPPAGPRLSTAIRWLPEIADLPLVLALRDDDPQALTGALEQGADVVIPASTSPAEVIARVRALLRRRAPHASGEPIVRGRLLLDRQAHRAEVDGAALRLDRLEFDLLHHLAAYPDRAQTRARLLARIWRGRDDVDWRTVDVYVGRLRDALAAAGRPATIETVRGVGYRMVCRATVAG